jgi:hypothetical protein
MAESSWFSATLSKPLKKENRRANGDDDRKGADEGKDSHGPSPNPCRLPTIDETVLAPERTI